MAEGGKPVDSILLGSEFRFDFYCELCKDDDKNVEAEGFCVDCGEYLCGSCYNAHQKTRQTRHHDLLSKEKMPKETPLSLDRISKDISSKCKVHSGKPLEFYCKTHGILGCNMCLLKDHRGCHGTELITETSENILDSQEYKDFVKALEFLHQRSQEVITKARVNISLTNTCYSDIMEAVKKLRKEVNKTLDQLEQDITAEAKALKVEEEQKMTEICNKCSAVNESVDTMIADLHSLQSSRRVCQVYIAMKENAKPIQKLQDNINMAGTALVVKKFWFKPNAKLQEFVERPYALGEIEIERERSQTNINQPVLVQAVHIADIEVSRGFDKGITSITGSAIVSSNRLVVVDTTISNVKLLYINSNKFMVELRKPSPLARFVVHRVPQSKHWDATALNRSQAAVTIPDGAQILILNVSDTLAEDRRFHVSGRCRGVAYNKNRLIVTYIEPPKLEIMDLSGEVIKTIQNDSDGNQLFRCPNYLCVSNDGETVYVSDCDSNKVVSLTFDVEVKSVYSDSELEGPMKVCVDHHDHVYVCGSVSRNVHMLTAELTKIQIILTQADGLDSNVLSISHCQKPNRLYVGLENNSKLKVFQLS